MATTPCFSTEQLRYILAAARDGAAEACGLLLARDYVVEHVAAVRNVSPSPRDSFEIDPSALLAAYRAERAGGPAVIGWWHTHPSGDPAPSRRDAADAAPDRRLWLIATAGEARLWRAVPCGVVHGRFDAVRFDVVDGMSGERVENNLAAVQHRAAGRGLTFLSGGGKDF